MRVALRASSTLLLSCAALRYSIVACWYSSRCSARFGLQDMSTRLDRGIRRRPAAIAEIRIWLSTSSVISVGAAHRRRYSMGHKCRISSVWDYTDKELTVQFAYHTTSVILRCHIGAATRPLCRCKYSG